MRKQSPYRGHRAVRGRDLLLPEVPSCHKAFQDNQRRRGAKLLWLTQLIRERLGESRLSRNQNRGDAVATRFRPCRSSSDRSTRDQIVGLWQTLSPPHLKRQ